MTNLSNDPRLTAYALGELSPEETREFEMELQKDPKAQKEVEEIKQTAALMKDGLTQEETMNLDPEKLSELNEQTVEKKGFLDFLRNKYVMAGLPALAASVLIVLTVGKQEKDIHYLSKTAPEKLKVDAINQALVLTEKKEVARKGRSEGRQFKAKKKIMAPKAEMDMLADEEALAPTTISPQSIASGSGAPAGARAKSMNFVGGGLIAPEPMPAETDKFNTEDYDKIENVDWTRVSDQPLSTFSVDVDTASYSNMRRFLNNGSLPPVDSVRIEEFVNYFDYDYEGPTGKHPFAVNSEQSTSPWNSKYKLVRIGVKGKEMKNEERPNSNFVFLLDVSGSMNDPNKLPLLKNAMKLLTRKLTEKDRVSIVVYAGASGLVLPSTPGNNKAKILSALTKLNAGGSTNGGKGIELAYKVAQENFIKDGINRVILATDGDFNVGNTSRGGLIRMIEEKAKSNVFLTVLGLGMGNYKDGTLEKLADKGNGNYAYLDTLNEAKKVLINDMNSTLITIAKDVKIQVEFNPSKVSAYRLIGYENRKLAAKDFNDDKKDAGEIGAGHTVTAFYEMVPAGVEIDSPGVDALKYQRPKKVVKGSTDELMTVKLRYKKPEGSTSTKIEFPLKDQKKKFESASRDYQFAASVASFAMILRKDKRIGDMSIQKIIDTAKANKGEDSFGYRQEFIENVELARELYRQSH